MTQGMNVNLLISIIAAALFCLAALYVAFVRRRKPTWKAGVVAFMLSYLRRQDVLSLSHRSTFENISDSIIVLDEDGQVVDMNPVAEKLTGMPASQGTGKPWKELWPDPKSPWTDKIPQSGEATLNLNNASHTFDLRVSEIQNRQGRIISRIVVLRDVSDRVQAEKDLLRITESTHIIIWHATVTRLNDETQGRGGYQWDTQYLNLDAVQKYLHLRPHPTSYPENILPDMFYFALLEEDRQAMDIRSAEALRTGLNSYSQEFRLRDANGDIHWMYEEAQINRLSDTTHEVVGAITEITYLKRAEEELRLSEKKYRTMFESMTQGVVFQAANGRIIDANPAAERILGLSLEQMQNLSSLDPHWHTLHEDGSDYPGETHPSMVALKTGNPVQNQVMGVYNSQINDYKWINIDAIPLFRPGEQNPYTVYTTFEDISKEKQLDEMLQRYQLLLKNVRDIILFVRASDGLILEANDAAVKAYGYARQDLVNKYIHDLRAPETGSLIAGQMTQANASGVFFETYHVRQDGSQFPIEVSSTGMTLGTERVLLSIIRDITERKQIEQDLHLTRFCVDQASIGIMRTGSDGRIQSVNEYACQMLGYTPQELCQMHTYEIDPHYSAELWRNHRQYIRTHGSDTFETTHRRKDGTTYLAEVTTSYVLFQGEEYSFSFIRDITERKKTEVALQESEYFLQKSQSIAQVGSYAFDALTGKWISSATLDELFGIDDSFPKNVDGWFSLIHPDQMEIMQHYLLQHVLAERNRFEKEYRIIRHDNQQERWVHGIGELEFDEQGNTIKMIGTIQDITERKQAEQALQMFQFSIDQASDAIFWLDREKGYQYVNDEACRSLGYTREELLDMHLWEVDPIYPAEQWNKNWDYYEKNRLGGTEHLETLHRRKDGSEFPVEVVAQHIWFGDHQLHVAYVRDITERKRTEELIRTLNGAALAMQKALSPNEMFAAVSDKLKKVGLTCAIFSIDESQRWIIPRYTSYKKRAIKAAERLTGLSITTFHLPIEALDAFRQPIVQRQTVFVEKLTDTIQQALPGSTPMLAGAVSKLLQVTKTIIAPLIVEGEVIGLFSVQSDDLQQSDVPTITAFANQLAAAWHQSELFEQTKQEVVARAQAEARVAQLNEELEQRVIERTAQLEAANKELEAFAYSISHDLRAPLRAIDGFTRILMEDYASNLDAEGIRVCNIVVGETHRMGELIDGLLAFSRIGRTGMQSDKINMKAIAEAVFQELTMPAERERINFHVDSIPPAIGDAKMVRQVWVNLIGNAIKFSNTRAQALIEVWASQEDGEITYSIGDNGVGFDMKYANKLFGVFQRLHSEIEFEGTGVGLAIVQRVVSRHGGRIWAESELGQGATFHFTLPSKVRMK